MRETDQVCAKEESIAEPELTLLHQYRLSSVGLIESLNSLCSAPPIFPILSTLYSLHLHYTVCSSLPVPASASNTLLKLWNTFSCQQNPFGTSFKNC